MKKIYSLLMLLIAFTVINAQTSLAISGTTVTFTTKFPANGFNATPVYLYTWVNGNQNTQGTGAEPTGTWPGTLMSGPDGSGNYTLSINLSSFFNAGTTINELNFIYNNGSGTKTADLKASTDASGWFPITIPNPYDNISFFGGFNSNTTPGEPMTTTDGITYSKSDFYFGSDNVRFFKDGTNTVWGGSTFPSGTAVENGAIIPLTTGFYNITFNKNTLAYSFQASSVSLIGDGISGGGWTTDIALTSTDGGKTFTKSGLQLVAGGVKFRVNNDWAVNWGGTAFPSGTGALNSNNNIPTTPGTYDVTFNRLTGAYTFTVNNLSTIDINKSKFKSFVSEGKLYTSQKGNLDIQVYDFSGKLVKKLNTNSSSNGLELNLPKKGNYLVKVNNEVVKIAY